MTGIYLSDTRNTGHYVGKLTGLLDSSVESMPLGSRGTVEAIRNNDTIILGYPTQFSNASYMVRDFIRRNAGPWKEKKLLRVSTMGAFSGDGAGCIAGLLKKHGAATLGGPHIRMSDSVCDSKLLKRALKRNREITILAGKEIESVAPLIKQGIHPKDGITFISHLAGLPGQRPWFYGEATDYTDKLKVSKSCIDYGFCVSLCPMRNISMKNGRATASKRCTMCCRCISHCPGKAITFLGKEVKEQCDYEKYRQGNPSLQAFRTSPKRPGNKIRHYCQTPEKTRTKSWLCRCSLTRLKKPLVYKEKICHNIIRICLRKKKFYMDYLYCMPDLSNTGENCGRIHNILARMSGKYKLNIVPESVKAEYFGGLDYCRKYRTYREIRETGGNSAKACLQADEKEMVLSVCRNQQGQGFTKSCTYVYCYPVQVVLKPFNDRDRKK